MLNNEANKGFMPYVFLDALDEEPTILGNADEPQEGNALFNKLMEDLKEKLDDDKRIIDRCRKVFISLRPEIFEEGMNPILENEQYRQELPAYHQEQFENNYGIVELPCCVLEPFTFKEAKKLYRYTRRSKRIPYLKTRKTNQIIMQRLRNKKDNDTAKNNDIIKFPFIVEKLCLLAETEGIRKDELDNLFYVLHAIIKGTIRREAKIIVKQRRSQGESKEKIKSDISDKIWKFMLDVGRKMLDDKNNDKNNQDYVNDQWLREYPTPTSAHVKSVRSMLIQTDKNGKEYQFIHSLIKYAVFAELLITDPQFTPEKRKTVLRQYRATELPRLYLEGIISKYGQYFAKEHLPTRIDEQHLYFTLNAEELERIASLFPDLKTITISRRDFDEGETTDVLKDHAFKVRNNTDIEMIRCFSDDWFTCVEFDMGIDLERTIACVQELPALTRLELCNITLKRLLEKWNDRKLPVLVLSGAMHFPTGNLVSVINDDGLAGEIKDHFSEILVCSSPDEGAYGFYKVIWNARCHGMQIRMLSLASTTQIEAAAKDREALEAMFELDRLTLQSMEEVNSDAEYRFLRLTSAYLRLLDWKLPQEKKKIEDGFASLQDRVMWQDETDDNRRWKIWEHDDWIQADKDEYNACFIDLLAYLSEEGKHLSLPQVVMGVYCFESTGISARYSDRAARDKAAFEYFSMAAEDKFAKAHLWMGICYDKNRGIPESTGKSDREKLAIQCFNNAVNAGNICAKVWLGACYYNNRGLPEKMEDTDRYRKAFECFREAAEAGERYAKEWLGVCYYNNRGLPEKMEDTDRYRKAFECFREAAEAGKRSAKKWLGTCYYYNRGLPEKMEDTDRYQKAFECFLEAAEAGDINSMDWVIFCYQNGIGIDESMSLEERQRKATEWEKRKREAEGEER